MTPSSANANNEGATKLQLAVMCIVVLASDITVTIVFPFGGFMVGDLIHHVNPDDTGYYFGWLASAFMLGRAVSVFPLSWASDRFGRKPFIYLGLIATFILNLAFGLSPNYGFAVAMRVLCGFLNAIIAIIRTMVGEMCPEAQQSRALAYVNGMWSLGLVLGSGIGGLLAQPAAKYDWAVNNAFANKYPYFLPMLLPAVLCVIAFVLTLFCLPETRGRRFTSPTSSKAYHTMGLQEMEAREGGDEDGEEGEHQAVGSGSDDDEERGGASGSPRRLSGEQRPKAGKKSIREQVEAATGVKARTEAAPVQDENVRKDPETGEALGIVNPVHVVFRSGRLRDALQERKVHLAIASEVCVSLVATGFDEILPLWAGSRVESGGLGLTSSTLGEVLASGGVIMAVWQLFAAPRIQDKIDMYHSFRLCCTLTCACMVGTPFFHYVTQMVGVARFGMLAALVVVLTLRNIFVTWCLTVSSILVNNSVPASQRGAVNGLTAMLSGLARSIGPPFGTMLFAFSLHKTLPYPLDFHFAFTFWGGLFFCIGLFSAVFPAALRHPAKDPNAEAEEREAAPAAIEDAEE